MITVGILSDTHISTCTETFLSATAQAFRNCDAIIHAGDLTDLSILNAFNGKEIYAVHGNMCNLRTSRILAESSTISMEGYTIGICHGAGSRHNIEDRMMNLFPEADCIVYGHTHIPVCHSMAGILFINPGSFQGTGPYGTPASYALLCISEAGIHGSLHQLQLPQ